MSFTFPARWQLAVILAVALVIRLGAAYWWQSRVPAGQRFGFPDSESYWDLGQDIAAGRPYEFGEPPYRIFRTPGYPLLLSGLFVFGGPDTPIMAARILSVVLGTITVGLAAVLARQLFDERVAVLAALAVAIYPEAIAPSVFVLSEAPFIPLMMVQLIAWIHAWRATCFRGTAGWSILAGFAAGLATLMRPSWLLFTPFALVIAILWISPRVKQLQIGAFMLGVFCLTMSPWWVRNYAVALRFVPTSLQVGASLYDGLNPEATGASDMRFVKDFEIGQRMLDNGAVHPDPNELFEDRLDEWMKQASLAWAVKNPKRVAELAVIKFLRIWSPLPNAAEFRSNMLRLILFVSYLPAMILAAVGIWKNRRLGWPVLLLILPAIYFTLLHVIFVSSIRYRQPAMVPLLVFSAAAVAAWLPAIRSSSSPTELPA